MKSLYRIAVPYAIILMITHGYNIGLGEGPNIEFVAPDVAPVDAYVRVRFDDLIWRAGFLDADYLMEINDSIANLEVRMQTVSHDDRRPFERMQVAQQAWRSYLGGGQVEYFAAGEERQQRTRRFAMELAIAESAVKAGTSLPWIEMEEGRLQNYYKSEPESGDPDLHAAWADLIKFDSFYLKAAGDASSVSSSMVAGERLANLQRQLRQAIIRFQLLRNISSTSRELSDSKFLSRSQQQNLARQIELDRARLQAYGDLFSAEDRLAALITKKDQH